MKILFWLNGSGGQRTEREIVEFPSVTPENISQNKDIIEDALNEWKYDIRCGSQFIRWGWDDTFDPVTKEPLSKQD